MSIPQSTSYVVTIPMYLSSDHVTEAGSALSPTVTISKNGAAFANPNAGASTATTVGNNVYKFTLATQDSNTLGDLWVRFTEATCDPGQRLLVVVKATNGGLTALPDTAVTTNASLLTSGTGTDQLAVSAGKVLLQATQTGVTIPTVTTVTDKAGYSLAITPPTSAAIATAVWQSLTTTNWGANTFGNFVLISNNGNRSVFVTGAGAGHVACDVHAMQPDVLTASSLATDAVDEIWAASNRTLTAFAFTPTVGGYAAGQDPATLLLVNGPTNKLQVNPDHSVNATATVDVNAVATAVANILFVDGATNQLKVNTDHTVNATVSGTIVNYVTIPSAVAQASILAAQITAVRGDTLTVALPIMGSLVGRTGLVFTAKKSVSDLDSEAILQVSESGGLVILNGSSTVVGTAQLSVTNATTGEVNLTLSAATTATIPLFDYLWDCQKVLSFGVSTPINGVLSVTGDVTRRTS